MSTRNKKRLLKVFARSMAKEFAPWIVISYVLSLCALVFTIIG